MENGFIRRSSSIGRHLMHISFKTKYCKKIFEYEEVESLCRLIFLKTAEEMKIDMQELGFDKDHVHMAMDIGLLSITEVAKKLKGRSGYKILRAMPWLKKKYFWGSGLWNGVIYFDSLGNNQDRIKKYVKMQGRQMRMNNFLS